MTLSGYRIVWLFVMFDLPVDSKASRKAYARFRTFLLEQSFTMMQFSIYIRCLASEDKAESVVAKIRGALPGTGLVRILRITDAQFSRMENFTGKRAVAVERAGEQLEFF